MKKSVSKRKTVVEKGVIVEKVFLDKKVVEHELNQHLDLKVGWYDEEKNGDDLLLQRTGDDLASSCPPANADGYYDKVGGNCVFFPYFVEPIEPDPEKPIESIDPSAEEVVQP